MSTTSPPPVAKKRIYLPLIFLVLIVATAIGFFVRGIWADTAERNPASAADGTVTQLLQKTNGNIVIRCAVIVNATPKEVWDVVRGYDQHGEFLKPYVKKVEATKMADGKFQIDGIAHSDLWGDWAFESVATHAENPADGEYTATWNEQDIDEFKVNRGGWRIQPADPAKTQTLLTFTIQVELKQCPNFIVRNIIMDRLHHVLKSMRDETVRRKQMPKASGTAPSLV